MRSVMARTATYVPAEGARPFPWRWMLVLGLSAYGLFLLLWAPASQPWSWVARQFPELSLDPGRATVWVGEVRPLRVAGREDLSVSWRFDPFALFGARLGYRITLKGTDLVVDKKLNWQPKNNMTINYEHINITLKHIPA